MANEPIEKALASPVSPGAAKGPGKPVDGKQPPAPPNPAERRHPLAEDDFWQRYSPHHEFPLSTAASVVLHMLVMLIVALFGSFLFNYQAADPPTVDAVVWAGGGGDPSGNSLDRDAVSVGPEAIEFDPNAMNRPENVLPQIPDLTTPAVPRAVEKTDKASQVLKRAKGMGGSGTGGGLGRGHGTGIGDGEGPGRQTKRGARGERWDIRFTYTTGEDYAEQLGLWGAYIAVPAGEGKYALYKNLRARNAKAEIVDGKGLSALNRVFFLNNDPQAAGALGHALGISPIPTRFWAFISQEREQEMYKQEETARKGKREEDVKATVFRAKRSGNSIRVQLATIDFFN